MLTNIKQALAPPMFEDENKSRVANLLNIILWALILISIVRAVTSLFTPDVNLISNLLANGVVIGLAVGMLLLMRAGRVKIASFVTITFLWILITVAILTFGGIRGPGYRAYATIILMAGLLLGGEGALGCAGASIVAGFVLFHLERDGLISPDLRSLSLDAMFSITTPDFLMVAVLVYLYDRGFIKALARAHRSERAMADHAEEIAQVNAQLQTEIAERARAEAETQRLAAIVRHTTDFIGQAAPDGTGLYVNAAGLALTGYTEAEFYDGMTVQALQPHLPPEALETALREGTWSGETTLRHKDGRLLPVSQVIMAIRDDTGALSHFATIAHDLTPQKEAEAERARLQQEIIMAQKQALLELSSPVIPVMDTPQGGIIVLPLIGSIDSQRAQDIMRRVLEGVSIHRAKVVILDVTGVAVMDTGIVNHLNKTIQAARLKGARTIVTGISDAVAEAIVDLGIDWGAVETLRDLQTGLRVALDQMNVHL